jgi:hypothetical protein
MTQAARKQSSSRGHTPSLPLRLLINASGTAEALGVKNAFRPGLTIHCSIDAIRAGEVLVLAESDSAPHA